MEPPRSKEGHTHKKKRIQKRNPYPSRVLPSFLVSSCIERACVCRGCWSTGFDPDKGGSVRSCI